MKKYLKIVFSNIFLETFFLLEKCVKSCKGSDQGVKEINFTKYHTTAERNELKCLLYQITKNITLQIDDLMGVTMQRYRMKIWVLFREARVLATDWSMYEEYSPGYKPGQTVGKTGGLSNPNPPPPAAMISDSTRLWSLTFGGGMLL